MTGLVEKIFRFTRPKRDDKGELARAKEEIHTSRRLAEEDQPLIEEAALVSQRLATHRRQNHFGARMSAAFAEGRDHQ